MFVYEHIQYFLFLTEKLCKLHKTKRVAKKHYALFAFIISKTNCCGPNEFQQNNCACKNFRTPNTHTSNTHTTRWAL